MLRNFHHFSLIMISCFRKVQRINLFLKLFLILDNIFSEHTSWLLGSDLRLILFRFEEEEGTDHDLLVPHGTNSVMVHNEHHTMSMMVVFLQMDTTSLEKSCLLEVFAHIVRESIITKLKHVVILGYVIGCEIRKLNNNTGLRIYVESQFPPTTVNNAIEDCLADVDEYLKTLSHSDFKIHVNGITHENVWFCINALAGSCILNIWLQKTPSWIWTSKLFNNIYGICIIMKHSENNPILF